MPLTRLLCPWIVIGGQLLGAAASMAEVAEIRMTPVVRAVRGVAPSVVNIQGQKTLIAPAQGLQESPRQVNGMGTGVVIDPRGYILTNHHVIDGVRQINVTLSDRTTYTAHKIAHDKQTDLAVIKIRAGRTLPVIDVGSSSDLMAGETVVAVGNAFGYQHTVTRGIVSALHRDVQVSDTQAYDDLIQTDASINPGNSGGPLLSIEGRMVGVNVAVRAGAQGIGFAIPVDKAMEVAARMLSIRRLENKWHGLETDGAQGDRGLIVRRVTTGSPAQQGGVRPGDVIARVAGRPASRPLDLELALLGQPAGRPVTVEVLRGDEPLELTFSPTRRGHPASAAPAPPADPRCWQVLGLSLAPVPRSKFHGRRYNGGMRVIRVRFGSIAESQGITPGDILVGMHKWETASEEDIRYIVTRPNLDTLGPMKFYILRGEELLFGSLRVAGNSAASKRR